jgi:hypothetical protein
VIAGSRRPAALKSDPRESNGSLESDDVCGGGEGAHINYLPLLVTTVVGAGCRPAS